MTLENFEYRTNPLFLRNQFSDNSDKLGIPVIPKPHFAEEELQSIRMLGFNLVKQDNGLHRKRIVHFFLYDYNFEKIWKDPAPFIELLRPYRGVLTPDFSMYTEMPPAIQLYNTFRNRWCGAYLAQKGLRVVPTVNWGTEESFDFCFAGIEKGSVVAVSTYMFHEHGNHADQKGIFLKGYRELLRRIEPEYVICYSEPFPEMEGKLIYVDYEMSSWRHMEDDIVSEESVKHTYEVLTKPVVHDIIKKMGYICKGGGSAFGGGWKPKKPDDQRFLGKPNTIKDTVKQNRRGGYSRRTKYGNDGRAEMERHETDHGRPDQHSNPHDHRIDWSKGYPDPQSPINYPNGAVPEFKSFYKVEGEIAKMKYKDQPINPDYNPDDYKFETLGEFKFYLARGWNVGFEYNGEYYGIEGHDNSFDIWIYDEGDIANGLTLEETLDYKFDGVKLRDLILTATIIERLCS